jgi:cytochrome c oxidase subunit 2
MPIETGSNRAYRIAAAIASFILAAGMMVGPAFAGLGQPSPNQITLQDAATPVAEAIHWFHDFVTIIIFVIAGFVLILLTYVILRYNDRANPTPSRVTHHTGLEVAWTVIPVLILVAIAIPSFKLLYYEYSYPPADLTIKATGKTWFWEHEYPDYGGFTITSNILRDEDILKQELQPDELKKRYGNLDGIALIRAQYSDAKPLWAKRGLVRQLSVDNEIAVPANKVVHVLVTSQDVIHNWTIPSFGSKVDAVPGRITSTWFKATKEGVYYGQCSELCGKDHSNMPITVRVVSEKTFADWADAMKASVTEKDSAKRRELQNRARQLLQPPSRAAEGDAARSTLAAADERN